MIERTSDCKVAATVFLTLAGAGLSLLAADEPSRQPFTEPLKGVSMVWVDDPTEPDGGYWRSKEPQPLMGPNIELYCRTLTYRSRGRGFFPEHFAFGYKEPFLVVKAASDRKPPSPSGPKYPEKKGLRSGIKSFISGERREQEKNEKARENARQAFSKAREAIGKLRSGENE